MLSIFSCVSWPPVCLLWRNVCSAFPTTFWSGCFYFWYWAACCCCSVIKSCPTCCDPMDCSKPGFPVHHLPEFAQIRVHWIGDTIQPSHPLSLPSPPAFSLSQHQGLFQCVSSSHQVAKVLELQHQAPSGLISFRTDWFDFLAVQGTLKRLLQHYNLKASILRAQCSLWSNFHIHTWLLEKL